MKKLALIIIIMLALTLSSCVISIKNDNDTNTDGFFFGSDNYIQDTDTSEDSSCDTNTDTSKDTSSDIDTDIDTDTAADTDTDTDTDSDTNIDTDTDTSADTDNICLSHSYGEYQEIAKATCQKGGEYARYCQNCNAADIMLTEKTDHIFEILVKYIVEPTVIAGGSAEYKCASCDLTEIIELEPIKLGGVNDITVEIISSGTLKIMFSEVKGAQEYEIYYSGSEINDGNFHFAPKASAEVEGENTLSATFRVYLDVNSEFYIAVIPYVDGRHGEIICIKVN